MIGMVFSSRRYFLFSTIYRLNAKAKLLCTALLSDRQLEHLWQTSSTPVKVLFVLLILRISDVSDYFLEKNKNQWLINSLKIVQKCFEHIFSS
jgi:hypothetical protein